MSQLIEREMRSVEVDCVCDCGHPMRPNGVVLMVNPPVYPHKCTGCGRFEKFEIQYPFIKYVPVVDASKG